MGTFTSTPQCTGAFMITNYNPGVGATYDRFADWWGGTAPLAGVDVTYYSAAAAADAALLGGQIDLIGQVQVSTDRALITNPSVQIFKGRGATHREVCMRVDVNNPLKHWQVRQAIALTLDRPAIVKQLFTGFADLGNDAPFAPVYGLTKGVPQRKKNIPMAKALMKAAGYEKGFSILLNTETTGEIPELAQIIKQSVKEIGIDMTLSIVSPQVWFGGTYTGPPKGWGNTPWLNTDMNITDWGGRPVPNVYLVAAFETLSASGAGVWNAAHYSNPTFDKDVGKFLAATTFKEQSKYATEMEKILQHDTPVIIPYFYYYLAAGSKSVKGYYADPQGQVYLSKTSLA
jgi:peptide/nickel transport system substrate-binding protein